MDPQDYIADPEEEVQILRSRVVELEEELRRAREELMAALERKVEEVRTFSPLLRNRRHAKLTGAFY